MGLSIYFNKSAVKTKKHIIARIARTEREHEALMARSMISHHTDMQDKNCGDCYDIHQRPSQTIFTRVQASTKKTTKEVAQPKAAPPLLWWRPTAANF